MRYKEGVCNSEDAVIRLLQYSAEKKNNHRICNDFNGFNRNYGGGVFYWWHVMSN